MGKINLRISSLIVLGAFFFSSCDASDDDFPEDYKDIEHHETVIVGAGISGLTSAYFLKNKDFLILEKENRVGGRAVSGVKNNFTYAKGTEYLGKPEEHLAKMIDGLGLKPKEIPSPMDAFFDGKRFYYGSDGIERYLISNSNESTYNRFVKLLLDEYAQYDEIPDLNYNSHAKQLDNTTANQWLINNNIPEVYINKYNISSRGLFGASLSEISALSFIPEAAFDYDESDLEYKINYVSDEQEYIDATEESSESYTFTKGITELTNKLGEQFGNKVRLNSQVIDIEKDQNIYVVKYINSEGKESIVAAKHVILAVPSPIALRIASSVLPEEAKEIVSDIEFASYATVALFSKTPIFTKAFDLAVPDDYFFTDIYDGTWVQRHYEQSTPQEYIMSVYIAPHTYKDHSLDTMSEQEMISKVYSDLDKVFPGASSKVTGYDIERFPYAYPVMTLGAYKRLLRLHELNTGTLVLAGDYMIYPTFESAVEAGYLAAETINDK